jgi:hypothetical protein
MKIQFTLSHDQAEAFRESLSHYFPGPDRKEQVTTFLAGCVEALIAAAAKGESINAPFQLVRFEQ